MPGAFLFLRCTAGLPAGAGSAAVPPDVTYFSLRGGKAAKRRMKVARPFKAG